MIVRPDHDVPGDIVQAGVTAAVIGPEDVAVGGSQLHGDLLVALIAHRGPTGENGVVLVVSGNRQRGFV
jgi:hypothetical protein